MIESLTPVIPSLINNIIIQEIIDFGKIYLTWSIFHYISSELYYKYCVTKKWYDIFFTPFYVETPHCKILNWIHNVSIKTMSSMTATIVTWGSKFIITTIKVNSKKD